MKKLIFILLIASCNTASNSLESRVKDYMKDSVVTKFDDPKSYEWVGMSIDTVTRHEEAELQVSYYEGQIKLNEAKMRVQRLQTKLDVLQDYGNDVLSANKKVEYGYQSIIQLDSAGLVRNQKYLSMPDSTLHHEVSVKFRAKNKMGGLVLDSLTLKLKDNKISLMK
jgi:hypothetical protein